jgi:hypothetical protein
MIRIEIHLERGLIITKDFENLEKAIKWLKLNYSEE